jgi:hypothetical protein
MTRPQPNNNPRRDRLSGTAIAYSFNRDEVNVNSADFDVDFGAETDREQLRACRLRRQKAGKSLPPASDYPLYQDIMVIIGAGASPNYVVHTLYRLIREIKNNEMVIGRKRNGRFVTEPFNTEKKYSPRRTKHEPFVRTLD